MHVCIPVKAGGRGVVGRGSEGVLSRLLAHYGAPCRTQSYDSKVMT